MMFRTLAMAGTAMLIASAAFAQAGGDSAYCKSLSSSYREYARSGQVDTDAAQAMSQCDRNPGAGIPVLEKILRDNRVKLPPRS